MRIGLSSLIGDGFGSGSFSFGEVPSGGSFPPNGTFYETLVGVEYPIAEGGLFISNPIDNSDLPIQVCDVDVYHDGTGGFYNDWANATNIAYKPFGTLIWEDPNAIATINPVEIPVSSGNYYDSATAYDQVIHDGSGWWTNQWAGQTYYPNGTEVDINLRDNYTTEVPENSGAFYNNGKYDTYRWNGSGGFSYSTNQGTFNASGGVINNISEMGTISELGGVPYSTGRIYNYLWNGSGGFTTTTTGEYFSNGTEILFQPYDPVQTASPTVEVPTGSTNYYDSKIQGEVFYHNGSGGYIYDTTTVSRDFPSGTFIVNFDDIDYYWDGTGGYYP